MTGPFNGVRILDMTSVIMGPLATQHFADLGADVIKVETLEGDVVRNIGPHRNPEMAALYMGVNRNKRSISLNLKTPEGREILLKLAADVDVLLYNIRPQAMSRLGLTYEAVRAVNPSIIYCGSYGFSQDGPYASKPAYDDLIQGAVGIPYLSQQVTGRPAYAPFALADHACGMYTAFCLAAALYHRQLTGTGQAVEVPMFETMAQTVLAFHMWGKNFVPPLGKPGFPRHLSPERKPFETADGHICMLLVTDEQWTRFFDAAGELHLLKDCRFSSVASRNQNTSEINKEVQRILRNKSTDEWMRVMEQNDLPATPMQTLEGLFDDPHLKETGFFQITEHPTEGTVLGMKVPSKWSESPPDEWRMPAPRKGQHTVELLRQCGYSAEQIDYLVEQGVISESI